MEDIEEIPIIWQKPHNSTNVFHIGTVNVLLDRFIKRYRKRLKIRNIMIDLEMLKNAAGFSNKTFTIKLHLTLDSGKIFIAESTRKSITAAMKNIVKEIDNQSRLTDREKHRDSARKHG